jgi:hypothetical protein
MVPSACTTGRHETCDCRDTGNSGPLPIPIHYYGNSDPLLWGGRNRRLDRSRSIHDDSSEEA